MASVKTIEIHSWKDPKQKWIINAEDFDPKKHIRWGEYKEKPKAQAASVAVAQKTGKPAGNTAEADDKASSVKPDDYVSGYGKKK